MTAILALIDEDHMYLAGDRAGVVEDGITTIEGHPKIWRCGPCLMGFSGDFMVQQVLQYELAWPFETRPKNLHEALARKIVPEIRSLFEDYDEVMKVSTILGCVYGKIFTISGEHLQLNLLSDDMAGTGGNVDPVVVLSATPEDAHPVDRIHDALLSLHRFTPGCVQPPYDILCIDKDGKKVYSYSRS